MKYFENQRQMPDDPQSSRFDKIRQIRSVDESEGQFLLHVHVTEDGFDRLVEIIALESAIEILQ